MLSKRIIACLDVRDGSVVKGVNFEDLRTAGDPVTLARRYNQEGIDEVVILDITATTEGRRALTQTINAVAQEIFIPLTVGGGIQSMDAGSAAIDAGADKVSLNTAALENPSLITTLATRYGSQAVVVAIDAKRVHPRTYDEPRSDVHKNSLAVSRNVTNANLFSVYARSGQKLMDREAVEWAREAAERGAGEILLTSIDRDGTREGFDCELTAAVSDAVNIPVIASGGAGGFDHFFEVFTSGRADAALAASIFHFSEHAVRDLKIYLNDRDIPVRI